MMIRYIRLRHHRLEHIGAAGEHARDDGVRALQRLVGDHGCRHDRHAAHVDVLGVESPGDVAIPSRSSSKNDSGRQLSERERVTVRAAARKARRARAGKGRNSGLIIRGTQLPEMAASCRLTAVAHAYPTGTHVPRLSAQSSKKLLRRCYFAAKPHAEDERGENVVNYGSDTIELTANRIQKT